MWVHTADGFYSAVQHREESDTLIIRARSRTDLERLRRNHPDQLKGRSIDRTFAADYPYRMHMSRSAWMSIMAAEAEAVDYDNFKDSLNPAIAVERHRTLLRVWSILQEIEYERSAKCRRPALRRPYSYDPHHNWLEPTLGELAGDPDTLTTDDLPW